MTNKHNLIIGTFLLLIILGVCVYAKSVRSQEFLKDSQWTEIVLIQHYGLNQEYATMLANVIERASQAENVPVETIIAIMAVESKFDHKAISKCHAIGLMQVRPDVWASSSRYNIHDKYENVLAGAWILGQYKDELGSWPDTIKSYNVGISNFRQGKAKQAGQRYLNKYNKEYRSINENFPRLVTTE